MMERLQRNDTVMHECIPGFNGILFYFLLFQLILKCLHWS